MDALSRLSAPRVLSLRIPYSCAGSSNVTRVESICGVEEAAAGLRRAACARAAARRTDGGASSDDEGWSSDSDDADVEFHGLRVQTLPVAATIGGKLWDASLLLSAWILECGLASESGAAPHFPPPAAAGARAPRVLELGAGLGIAGLVLAKAFPHLRITLSDYDPALLANLEHNVALNAAAGGAASAALDVAAVDFRDFTRAAAGSVPPRYAEAGLCGYDLLLGSDIVYDAYHGQLAQVVLSLLAPPAERGSEGWRPRAIFMLPDSRPRLREFVHRRALFCLPAPPSRCALHTARGSAAALYSRLPSRRARFSQVDELEAVGLDCRIERFDPECAMVRRLRRSQEGWGVDASFSLYHVSRRL